MLYFLDNDPRLAAEYIANRHLSSQLCCSCSLISTVLHKFGFVVNQKSLKNNKILEWMILSKSNYSWVVVYAKTIYDRFALKYGHCHKISIDLDTVDIPEAIPDNSLTEFPWMIPSEFQVCSNRVEAIRNFYANKKTTPKDFDKIPFWYSNKLEESNKILYSDFFKDANTSLRLYMKSDEECLIQKMVGCTWVTINKLGLEECMLIRRILKCH